MNHGKKLAVTIAYDVYKECTEGKLEPSWKVDPVDFHRFREKLALQMLRYNPANRLYPGDENLRAVTRTPKKKRKRIATGSGSSCASTILESDRICGDLGDLIDHIWKLPKNSRLCVVCGKSCHQVCGLCDAALHYYHKPDGLAAPCFFYHHDAGFCGLARNDCGTMGTPKKDWKLASSTTIANNRKAMKTLASGNNTPSRLCNSGPDSRGDDDQYNPSAI